MGPTLFEAPPALSAQELCLILKRDLTSFIERSFYELHPGHRLDLAPHIEVIATRLEAVRHGEIRRLIINLPPRHLKSHCVSVAFIAWLLGHHPAKHVICASYGQDLADDFAAECQRVMRSPFYRFLFGDVLGARQAGNDFETVGGRRRLATSVGGVLTGRGADIIVLDDPQKADDVLSETTRKATHTWFDNTLLSRLNDKLQGSIIIVMQRLHQDDLVGHVLKQGHWDVLSLPAIAEVDECHLIDGPLGRRFFRRMPGDALHPARESAESLANTRRAISEFIFASQYQQNPISLERVNAINAERERRFSEAYRSNDQLNLGRLWHNRITETLEDEISDDLAMTSYQKWAAIVEKLEREI
jgi:hypothetical protein